MLLLVAKIASFHQQQEVFDTLMYLLCGFTGLLGDPPVRLPRIKQIEVTVRAC